MKKSLVKRQASVFLFLILVFDVARSQSQSPFVSYSRLDRHDTELIDEVKLRTNVELNKLTPKNRVYYFDEIKKTERRILEQIKNGRFLVADSLHEVLNTTFNTVIKANELEIEPPIILISEEPVSNASTYMIGVFSFSIGLLSSIQNEDELAFVIAHELVHCVNYHTADRIYEYYESGVDKNLKDGFRTLLDPKHGLKNLERIQSNFYGYYNNTREHEIEADSLGLVFMEDAGYDVTRGVRILPRLGYKFLGDKSFGPTILSQLFPKNYKLKEHWFADRLPIFEQEPDQVFIFKYDSILTHPNRDLRMKLIEEYYENVNFNYSSDQYWINENLLFEVIEGARTSKRLDVCLYLSLIGLMDNQSNPYLVSVISKVFLDLRNAKYDNLPTNHFYMYVSPYTIDYGEDLKRVNTFLCNLSRKEMLEIGYHFLNNPRTFNPSVEKHYALLMQYCELTGRQKVAIKITEMYNKKFPDGKLSKLY